MGGECSDISFYCPNGNIMTIGQCYDGFVGCETCAHESGQYAVRVDAYDDCYMESYLKCDESTWLNRADGCTDSPWEDGDFVEACDMHDLCYASGIASKDSCDSMFYYNIIDATGDTVAASIMYLAVQDRENADPIQWGIDNCKPDDSAITPFNELPEMPMVEPPIINVYSLIGYNIFGYYILNTTLIDILSIIFALSIGIFIVYGLKKICKKMKGINKYKAVKFESYDESYDEEEE